MKQILFSCLLFIACFSFVNTFAQTALSGGIYTNTTWTLANSPYVMTGPVVVFPNATLTIEPGVVVKIQDNGPNSGFYDYLEIRGTLNAVGTATAPISFVADSATTDFSYAFWGGIKVQGDQGGTADIAYVNLAHAYFGLSNNIVLNDTLTLVGCHFQKNTYGISINAPLKLENCLFTNNNVGIGMMIVQGSVTTNNCAFDSNFVHITTIANGVNLQNSTFSNGGNGMLGLSGVINNCNFSNNDFALQESGGLTITNSVFSNNGTAIKGLSGSTVKNCFFSNNVAGLDLLDNSVVEDNQINNNEIGLSFSGGVPNQLVSNVKNNQICYNSSYNVENRTNYNLGLQENCFCESDSAIIEAKIYDGYDDITKGLINFAVYDSACQNVLYYVIKVNLGPVSIDEQVKSNTFVISPNPMQTEVSVLISPDKVNKETIQVLDLQGKVYYSQRVTAETALISLPNLPSGIYFMKIGNAVQKFIKE